jgi:hypothetical protein
VRSGTNTLNPDFCSRRCATAVAARNGATPVNPGTPRLGSHVSSHRLRTLGLARKVPRSAFHASTLAVSKGRPGRLRQPRHLHRRPLAAPSQPETTRGAYLAKGVRPRLCGHGRGLNLFAPGSLLPHPASEPLLVSCQLVLSSEKAS